MNPGTSRERLEELIASSGVPLASLTPRAGLELMLRIYGDDPADGYLSCSWGVVSRYGKEEFGFDITLWFLPSPDDPLAPAPPNLSLIFKVGPRATAGNFPGWMEWCAGPEHLTAFRSTIQGSPPFKVWGRSPAAGVALVCQDSGSWAHALFDCWGDRDPSRPVVSMTEEEWSRSDDVSLMLRWFRQEWQGEEADLDRILQRYLLACCRQIWRLLPMEKSRRGIEFTERYIEGMTTREEFARAEWDAEGAAFYLDPFDEFPEPEDPAERETHLRHEAERRAHNDLLVKEVEAIPPEELNRLVRLSVDDAPDSPRELLASAAYFVDASMAYPGLTPKESIERYRHFLYAPLLREVVGNPFRSGSDQASA